MFEGFKRVLIIEPRTDSGRLLRDVLKDCGVQEGIISQSVKDAWDYLQTADSAPDWIISVCDKDARFNYLHLMQLLVSRPELVNTRISLLLEEEELDVIPVAFELGMLNYFKKPFTKQTIGAEIQTMLGNMPNEREKAFEFAADNLRNFLNDKENYPERIKLERQLVSRFPKILKNYVSLAEAQILGSEEEEARKTLSLAKHLGADFELSVKQLGDLIEPSALGEVSVAETFDIKNVLIVDSDDAAAKAVEQCVAGLGVQEIAIAADGEAALAWLKEHGEPSLLISEWKIPKISGAALVQRVRQMGMVSLPIIITSAQVKDKDRHLIKEIGANAVLSKPVMKEFLVSEIFSVIHTDRMNSSAADMERKIRQLLEQKKVLEAQKVYAEFAKMPGVPPGLKIVVEANVLFHSGKYPEARDLALAALKDKGDAVLVLNLLSKIFLKLNDRESALKCLNRAQEFSSDNLERLVLMAEAYADSGDTDQAKKVIADAQKIDATNEVVIQAAAEVAIAAGESGNAKAIIGEMDSAMSLIANMNNRAVLLVGSGEVQKGIALYINAEKSLPEKLVNERDAIQYNMCLAFARTNNAKEAKKRLEELVKRSSNKPMVEKAKSLLKRVEEAIVTKQKIKLNITIEKKSVDIKPARGVKPVSLHVRAGDICLHGIYDASQFYTDAIRATIDNCPPFTKVKQSPLQKLAG